MSLVSEDPVIDVVGEQVAPAAPTITVQDLINIRAIVDVATSRGAFKSAEFSSVGEIYNKLDAYINSITADAQPPAPEDSK